MQACRPVQGKASPIDLPSAGGAELQGFQIPREPDCYDHNLAQIAIEGSEGESLEGCKTDPAELGGIRRTEEAHQAIGIDVPSSGLKGNPGLPGMQPVGGRARSVYLVIGNLFFWRQHVGVFLISFGGFSDW